ncbi:MAG: CNNM domain-containing protein [Elusimicrobiales bacterium]|nr:CNNM domain-containing protein [Elusimicrobiales bacterium]
MELFKIFSIIFFLGLNGVFVLAEFAIVSVRRTRIEELAQNEKNIVAKISLEILNNINAYLASIQLGITASSIGLGWVAQPYVSSLINSLIPEISLLTLKISSYSISIIVSFFIVTFAHIVLGEQVPKYIAISASEKVVLLSAIPLKVFYKITYYPMLIINNVSEFFVSLIGLKAVKNEASHSEDEIRLILSKSEEIGKISLQRLMMFDHLFDFGKTTVKEVMVPVDKIISLNLDVSFDDFFNIVCIKKFSRYPVKNAEGNFIGYVHIKDIIFNNHFCTYQNFSIQKCIRPLYKVKENEFIENVLRLIQENHQPMLIVENEKGEITGLLTIEDILEDLTGEIHDEFEIKQTLRLDEIFNVEGSIVGLKSKDRFSAIIELVDKLSQFIPSVSKNDISEKIIKREKLFSTAIGHQIAIPHARIEGLEKPIISVGISEDGIDFSSPDIKPVKVIFLILTPYYDPSSQLSILSKISKLALNTTLRKKLFKARNPIKIKEIFTIFEDSVPV